MTYSFECPDLTFGEQNAMVWLLADGDCTQTADDGSTEPFAYRFTGVLVDEGAQWRWLLLAGSESTPA